MSLLSRQNVGSSTSYNPTGLHGLLRGSFAYICTPFVITKGSYSFETSLTSSGKLKEPLAIVGKRSWLQEGYARYNSRPWEADGLRQRKTPQWEAVAVLTAGKWERRDLQHSGPSGVEPGLQYPHGSPVGRRRRRKRNPVTGGITGQPCHFEGHKYRSLVLQSGAWTQG
jgi:hypothetical protein